MRPSHRFLAAISRSQPSKLKKPSISLDHFIQRQRVLSLWREIVRALISPLTSLIARAIYETNRYAQRSLLHQHGWSCTDMHVMSSSVIVEYRMW
ncbi:hypothetical protein PDIG_16470 [Penicillium digitatum PHI26]|uniref:Uncharacterized protein n=2 Tax=Penicillium digitatum TaxID=36651 RepID=K9G5C4_PEND2|nr:hypothetical protein PDIP_87980 [Penicillium digitatum Pd1]EKV04290.1 hypothetical protein PDIP_87980 [Penicillium digitatum Pd1]EKV17160.1 hypothetical protein PDIG_16470 [Penicillium digitatum PHI26]